MSAAIFAFTSAGRETARRVKAALGGAADIFVPAKFATEDCEAYAGSLAQATGGVFDRDAVVFVGACGIAVRAIAPYVAAKTTDPAVLCVDERARFVISLLSGHIGGANRLAHRLARELGATPVVTTATDVNGKFSVDAWAAERDMAISDMSLAKRVSAEILERDIPFFADLPEGKAVPAALPDGLRYGDSGELGICVSPRLIHPFGQTLLLTPRVLRVGIGCRRGTERNAIAALVGSVFRENRLNIEAVGSVASIDVKADEDGLNAFCRAHGWQAQFYSADRLNAVPGTFSASAFVRQTVGVDNVCERAAMADGGRLIVHKTAQNGVTVAVAEMDWGIDFV